MMMVCTLGSFVATAVYSALLGAVTALVVAMYFSRWQGKKSGP